MQSKASHGTVADHEEFPELYSRAVIFAVARHAGQFRKGDGSVPYAVHPIRVCERLRSQITPPVSDPVMLVAALLHDTVEDTATSFEEIEREFGPEVAALVATLTNDESLPKPERKAQMIERFRTASLAARVVKLADRLDNLGDIPDSWTPVKRQSYLEETDRLVAAIESSLPFAPKAESTATESDLQTLTASLMDLIAQVRRQQVRMGHTRPESHAPTA